MAEHQIRSGRRGRPMIIDPEAELNKFSTKYVVKMQKNLEKIRRETSGERSEMFIGSETSFPDWVQQTLDVLQEMRENQIEISYDTAKQIKKNLKMIEQLASRQERVRGRALDVVLTQDYLAQLEKSSATGSTLTRELNEKLRAGLMKLTPQQRQQFYFSRQYQDIRTQSAGRYKHILTWAQDKTGCELTAEEAWAELRYQRFLDFGEKN